MRAFNIGSKGGLTNMTNIFKLSITLALGFLISVFCAFSIGQLITETASAQDEDYYQEVEDGYESPEYDDPVDADDFDNSQPQNPDPEFMDEIEPGEFDQSDDVTELDENNL
jgi:hypothetical protein